MKQLDEPKGVQCPSFQTRDLTWAYTDSQSCYNPDKLRIKDGRQCSLIRKTQKKGPFCTQVTVTAHSNQRGVHSEWICCEHGKCWSITGAVWVTADLLVLGMIRSKRCVALLHVFQVSSSWHWLDELPRTSSSFPARPAHLPQMTALIHASVAGLKHTCC